ncbi:hypothetical protein AFCA_009446 [Aspergillus flavus]|nr:hypothetical protein AFCA_009446 [Aspergillus flavus]
MVKDHAVDIVVVTTAPDSHLELAKLALNAGKHVVVEKPFTPTYQEAQKLIDLAKKQSRLLTVYLTIRPAKRITAFLGNQREGIDGSDDSFTVLMHYDEFMATAKAAVISPQEKQLRFWVRGTKGTFKKFYFDVQEEQLKSGMRPGDDGYGIEPSERYRTLTSVQPNGAFKTEAVPTVDPPLYTEFYSKLAEALAGEGEVSVSPEESAAVIRLVEIAVQSSKTGRTLDVDLCS